MRALVTTVLALFSWLVMQPLGRSEVGAKVKVADQPIVEGKLEAKDGVLTVVSEKGERHEIDLDNLLTVEVEMPRLAFDVASLEPGELRAPWTHKAVGELPHGGRAEVKSEKIVVETSSAPGGASFDSFYIAYRPLPDGDAQITTRVDRIDSYEDTTRGGVILCDGAEVESRKVLLSLSHREHAAMRSWQSGDGLRTEDHRGDIRPGRWLRLVRSGGKVTGYVSIDAAFWRKIGEVDDEFEGQVYAGLVAQGTKPRRRWSATFQNIDVVTTAEAGPVRLIRPQVSLVDGTVFHGEIASGSPKLLKLGGQNAGRVLPALSVANIEFYRPIAHDRRHHLSGERSGVLLANGDFFESSLVAIDAGKITTSSTLFGKREFSIETEVDALVLRPAPEAPKDSLPFLLETWAGGKLTGKAIRVEGDQIAIDTLRLRSQRIPLEQLRRITRRDA